jgi:methionyl-tRNA formyltransferase
MRILILSQDENVYLPNSFATVCRELGDQVVAIVVLPAMSTHGGALKGFLRHASLFGLVGTIRMVWKVVAAKILAKIRTPGIDGPFHSVHSVAAAFDLPYHYEATLKSRSFQTILDECQPDLLISISCPQIIGKSLRDQFSKGCINVHGAPLPKYRGLMPAFWALKNDESTTATTVHDLEEKLDDGDIILQREVAIAADDTWNSLVLKTKAAGAEALIEAVRAIESGTETRRPNLESEASYFSFPSGEDRRAFLRLGRRFF